MMQEPNLYGSLYHNSLFPGLMINHELYTITYSCFSLTTLHNQCFPYIGIHSRTYIFFLQYQISAKNVLLFMKLYGRCVLYLRTIYFEWNRNILKMVPIHMNLFLLYYVRFLGHNNCMQVKDMLNSRKTTSIHYYAIRGINEAVHFGS